MKGKLLLLPNLLDRDAHWELFLPQSVQRAVLKLNGLIAESEREARAYLKRFGAPFRELPIRLLNKHHKQCDPLLQPIRQGEHWGLISDAGLPVIADPGSGLVARARDFNITVQAFVGPSALIMALMLSGLCAQRFAFHGYLPKKRPEKWLKQLERRSCDEGATQLFMEAPFRNEKLLALLLDTLADTTALSVAWDLTLPSQGVQTHPVEQWKRRSLPVLHKKPAVFLLNSTACHDHRISVATVS